MCEQRELYAKQRIDRELIFNIEVEYKINVVVFDQEIDAIRLPRHMEVHTYLPHF